MIYIIYTAIIVSATCWAIHAASDEDQLLWPIVKRLTWLQHNVITGCPKCMPTFYSPILCAYLIYFGYPVELHMLPLIWLISSGANAVIIKYLET